MPQLDKFTYFSQFFWSCLFLFTFYILICNDGDGVLGISRILKLRNQLLSHRGETIRSKDPNSLEDRLRKGFSTGVSYMYSSLFEVSQWCKAVDLFGKRRKITLISCFGEICGSRGMEINILYSIKKSFIYIKLYFIIFYVDKRHLFLYIVLGIGAFSFFNELMAAVVPWLPSSSLGGGINQPPTPPGEPDFSTISQSDDNADILKERRESLNRGFLPRNKPFEDALICQDDIGDLMELFIKEEGIFLEDTLDIQRGVEMYLFDIMQSESRTRKRRLLKIISSLRAHKAQSPFFYDLLTQINSYSRPFYP